MRHYSQPTPVRRVRKRRWASLHAVAACGKDFCMKTSMHGFIHIAAPNRSWSERVLWACATVAAIMGAIEISLGQWQRYNENPTVVALEKDFRSWQFSLPGVTICLENKVDEKKLPAVIKRYWSVEPHDERYGYYSSFVAAVAGTGLLSLQQLQGFEGEELEVDLYQLAVDVMPELNTKATWSEASWAAVGWFPIMSELGACYASNSLAIADNAIIKPNPNETAIFPLLCEYLSLRCYVAIEVHNITNFYIHSPYDIMDVTSAPSRCNKGMERNIELSVIETRCGRGVRALHPLRRRCLYADEAPADRQVYSTNTCRRSCRNRQALRLCGCKPFFNYFEEGPPCSLEGMRCLAARAHNLTTLSECTCASMCVDAIFMRLSNDTQIWDRGPFMLQGVIRFKVQAPRTRYTREIVFHFQDLVVSFGGAAGLFLGASFISFVEILYFVIEWVLGTFREENGPGSQVHPSGVLQIKKSKLSYEQARILELTAILEQQELSTHTAQTSPSRQLH